MEYKWYSSGKNTKGIWPNRKKSDNILTAHYELGIIFEIDVNKREVVQKNYLR